PHLIKAQDAGSADASASPPVVNGEPPAAVSSPVSPPALSPEGYRTAPDQTNTGWPPGIPHIVGNEVCERFSFYGMKAILMVHLIALYTAAGVAEASEQARGTMHLFIAGVYALPM